MSRENVDIARRACRHFTRGDREALRALMAPEAEIVPLRAALEGTVYRGPDALDRFFADTDDAWDTISLELTEVRDLGNDGVLITGRLQGRGRQTGATVDSPMGWLVGFEDGKIKSFRTYPSVTDALEAAGLSA